MEMMPVSGLTLFFDAEEREAAELIRRACEKSVQLIHEYWGLGTPQDLRVYVLTSAWLRSTFHSAPWGWRILMGLSLPLWYFRTRRLWQVAGGWQQQYGQRRTVGIKTPRLILQSDSGIGDRVYIRVADVDEKVQHITCHELAHAFTSDLKLPVWLHEGLAMVTAERYAVRVTIRRETLDALRRSSHEAGAGSYRGIDLKDPDAVAYQYVRGYWITRYLEETQPGRLKSLLVRRYSHPELESQVAFACGMKREEFWRRIDGIVAAHFS
jgi:hypothetical protein